MSSRTHVSPLVAERSISESDLAAALAEASSLASSSAMPVRVQQGGEIEVGDSAAPRRLGRLSSETFAAQRPGLDQVAAAVAEARRANKSDVTVGGQQLGVDPDGNFVVADGQGGQRIGRLSPETFAVRTEDAVSVDDGVVNARWVKAGNLDGWAWSITTEFGDEFNFFGFWDLDRRLFFTMLGSPRLEGRAPSAHDLHLYPDGTVCLTPVIGCRDLAHAHQRSALWARGASCWLAGLGFVFNPGQ